jgi:septal ring factor EnvC (AmiA/AmiB activator)
MKNSDMIDKRIKRLEEEIISLQDEQTALLKKKYIMEDEIRKHNEKIKRLQVNENEEREGKKAWQKATALLLAAWVLFLSLMGIERK